MAPLPSHLALAAKHTLESGASKSVDHSLVMRPVFQHLSQATDEGLDYLRRQGPTSLDLLWRVLYLVILS